MAELNLNGKTKYRSKLGGFCGLVASLMIFWFFITKVLKMVRRLDANRAEVNEGLDLMAADAKLYGFQEHKFKVGVGFSFEKKVSVQDPNTLSWSTSIESSPIERNTIHALFDLNVNEYKLTKQGGIGTNIEETVCDSDKEFDFLESAICFDDAKIGGDTMLKRGTMMKFWWNYNHCEGEAEECSHYLGALEQFGTNNLVVMIFVQEDFIDFSDFQNPFKHRTKVINKISLSQKDYLERYVRRSISTKVRLNTAKLLDIPWVNPWAEEVDQETVYLTVENTNVEQSKWPNDFFESIF